VRVLFVNNFRGRGGGEEFLRDLLPGLVRRGIDVGLVCRPGTPLEAMFRDGPIALHLLPWSPAAAPRTTARLASLVRRRGYDIVNVQRGHDILEGWLAARLSLRRPVLLYTPQVPEFPRSRFLLTRPSRIVTISRHIADRVRACVPSLDGRVTIVHYGIDLAAFDRARVTRGGLRRRLGVRHDTPLVGTVGDLWKNQIEFLDALVAVRREVPGTRYVLVAAESDSAQVRAFKARVAALGLEEVVLWAGRLPKDQMAEFYADLDLAVTTHRDEGFGIWILEAQAMGVPVVAYDAGGVRDALEGSDGGQLVPGGPSEMAAAVAGLLRDPARRARLAAAGPGWVAARFGRDRMIDDYVRLFESAVRKAA
jgi:glycosyltransferase involved in cell wall biosynthesis